MRNLPVLSHIIISQCSLKRMIFVLSCLCLSAFYFKQTAHTGRVNSVEFPIRPSIAPLLHQETEQACIHPDLPLYKNSFSKLFRKLPPPVCTGENNWVRVWNGSILFETEATARHGSIHCDYFPILRVEGDFKIEYGKKTKEIKNGTAITHDHFKVECRAADNATYSNVHTGIRFDESVRNRAERYPSSSLGLSVLMIGYDSVSRLAWERLMPLTHNYFTEALDGLVLKGYNVLGDGTVAALQNLLTGHNETELPEARKGVTGAKHVDGHPFIWKEFENSGFVTQFAEDEFGIGCFTYRFLGFKDQPVDHYMRPYYIAAERTYKKQKPFCMGSIPRHKIMLNMFKDTFSMYGNKPKFSFGFMSEFSHDDNNRMSFVDTDLKEFLVYLQTNGYLDKTMVVLMADHGARYGQFRNFPQGKIEERMPYFGIRLPKWFAAKYPDAMTNLRTNAERLTTSRDVHATLHDVFNFTGSGMGNISHRAISLFKEIPKERRCSDASIEPHWCTCMKFNDMDKNTINVKNAVSAVIYFINDMTKPYRDDCQLLKVENITKASKYLWNKEAMRFKKSISRGVPDLSDEMTSPEDVYQVSFCVTPSHACFEATVKLVLKTGVFLPDKNAISRINRYGNQPQCILGKSIDLRKYCFCGATMNQNNSVSNR